MNELHRYVAGLTDDVLVDGIMSNTIICTYLVNNSLLLIKSKTKNNTDTKHTSTVHK